MNQDTERSNKNKKACLELVSFLFTILLLQATNDVDSKITNRSIVSVTVVCTHLLCYFWIKLNIKNSKLFNLVGTV
jgi:Rieske Fe-S protein